ncbi:MAG: hypothetical protein ACJ8FY_27330 [Gemmataceae bacterium]
MPPRSITLAIIAFWLAMTGWVLYKEIWPRWQADNPPAFTIDLTDEAQPNGPNHIPWNVAINGRQRIFHLETWVKYAPKEDLFELHSEMWPRIDSQGQIDELAQFGMKSKLLVTREGELQALDLYLTPPFPPQNDDIKIELLGEVKGGKLVPRIRIPDRDFDKTFDPVPISERTSVLNPLQPLNKLPNLRPGQKWRMPVVDPVGQAFGSFLPLASGYVRYFDAEVLSEMEELPWKGRDVPCRIIQYSGEDASGRTWVRESDGLVLQQEVNIDGKTLILQREP